MSRPVLQAIADEALRWAWALGLGDVGGAVAPLAAVVLLVASAATAWRLARTRGGRAVAGGCISATSAGGRRHG
jgi:hypothetical protein